MVGEKVYGVVEFVKTNCKKGKTLVQAVPKTWIINKEGQDFVLWPSKKKDVGTLIKRCVDPVNDGDWEEFIVKKIHLEEGKFSIFN